MHSLALRPHVLHYARSKDYTIPFGNIEVPIKFADAEFGVLGRSGVKCLDLLWILVHFCVYLSTKYHFTQFHKIGHYHGVFFGFLVPDCTRLNNLAKKGKKLWSFSPENFKLKKKLGWNCQIVDENRIMDMWYVLMWYFLSNMWMNI